MGQETPSITTWAAHTAEGLLFLLSTPDAGADGETVLSWLGFIAEAIEGGGLATRAELAQALDRAMALAAGGRSDPVAHQAVAITDAFARAQGVV